MAIGIGQLMHECFPKHLRIIIINIIIQNTILLLLLLLNLV